MEKRFRILCAVDGSRPAAAAFEQALAMSERRGAQLVLVHAVSKDRRYSWRAVERTAALAALRERAEALNVPVRVRVQQGDAAGVILLHARAQAPDLIVLGSNEPAGFARFRFRSIADRVVLGATCPVMLIPAAHTQIGPDFHTVLCAIDPSPRSPGTIANAARLAGDGARLVLLPAGDDMLRVASEIKADLIVLGATRRSGLRRRLFGSTALHVSRRSHLPVLIVPDEDVKRNVSTLDEDVLGWAA